MRENRTHGSEGGESGSTGLPYPYTSNRFPAFSAKERAIRGTKGDIESHAEVVATPDPKIFRSLATLNRSRSVP